MNYKIILIAINCICLNAIQGLSQALDTCTMGNTDNNPPCCNGLIITDPSMAYNPDYTNLTDINRLDWRTQSILINMPNSGYGTIGGAAESVYSPFWSQDSSLRAINFYNYPLAQNGDTSLLDYHPRDGWEMMSFWDGFTLSGSPISANPRTMPYIMLYNRYTGKLRFLGSLPDGQLAHVVRSQLNFREGLELKYSALLGKYSGQQQVLSEKTKIRSVSTLSPSPSPKGFFLADFDLAYDPCICNNNSELAMSFSKIETGRIDLTGRFLGTTTAIDDSGNAPLLNGRNFLTSIYNETTPTQAIAKSGYLTYHNIDGLMDKYKDKSTVAEKLGMGIFKGIVKLGLNKGLGVVDSKLISPAAASIINWSLDWLTPNKEDSVKANDLGINLMASNTDRIMGWIGLGDSKTPNISIIEGEMSMVGTLNLAFPLNTGHSIRLYTPGSKGSNTSGVPATWESNHNWGNYPLFNEAVGVMAVLDSVEVYKYAENKVFDELNSFHEVNRYQFSNIKYTFNPVAEVDEAETKIYAALVFKNAALNTQVGIRDVGTFLINGQNITNTTTPPRDYTSVNHTLGDNEYITPFFALEYLPSYIAGDFETSSNMTVQVRLLVDYTFKKNRYGKVNKALEVITLPVKLKNGNLQANRIIRKQESLPNQRRVNKVATIGGNPSTAYYPSAVYTDNKMVGAYAQIFLRGRHEVAANKEVTYKAPEIIVSTKADTLITGALIVSNDNVLKPGVKLVANTPVSKWYSQVKQVPKSEVSQFCGLSKYRANQAKDYIEQITEDPAQNSTDAYLRAMPNPFENEVNLAYFVPSPSFVTVSVYNMMGQLVQTISTENIVYAGEYNLTWNSSNFMSGIYFISMQGENFRKTIKVIKQ